MRLAFAVAAHLDPEILIVDEVLAVGDADFQKKCLGKMGEVAGHGRTVLFVSHNMSAVQALCSRAILIDRGRTLIASNQTKEIIQRYLQVHSSKSTEWICQAGEYDRLPVVPLRIYIGDQAGNLIEHAIRNDESAFLYIEADIHTEDPTLEFGYALFSSERTILYLTFHWDSMQSNVRMLPGRTKLRSKLPSRMLNEGSYSIEIAASLRNTRWIFEPGAGSPGIAFEIRGGLSDSPLWLYTRDGVLAPIIPWETLD